MSDNTGIEWADATWNPVTGCTKLSPASRGCQNCYASTFAERFRGTPGHYFEHGFDVQLRPDKLGLPLRWRRPRRIFVNSMSDLFHEQVPDDYIAHVFAVMQSAAAHTFQVLTKRHARMRSLLTSVGFWEAVTDFGVHVMSERPSRAQHWPDTGQRIGYLPNVWLGVSAEDARWAKIRGDALRDIPAAVRFFSCEPLLGPIDDLDLRGIGWVITGGESGPGARPMDPQWARDIRDQCVGAGVAFVHKQNGEWVSTGRYGLGVLESRRCYGSATQTVRGDITIREILQRVGKRSAGRELDGHIWDQYPEVASVR